VIVTEPGTGPENFAGLSVEERAKKEWDSKPELRAEFKEQAAYVAFLKADAKGLVKILKK
jgi:hypothetical protein